MAWRVNKRDTAAIGCSITSSSLSDLGVEELSLSKDPSARFTRSGFRFLRNLNLISTNALGNAPRFPGNNTKILTNRLKQRRFPMVNMPQNHHNRGACSDFDIIQLYGVWRRHYYFEF